MWSPCSWPRSCVSAFFTAGKTGFLGQQDTRSWERPVAHCYHFSAWGRPYTPVSIAGRWGHFRKRLLKHRSIQLRQAAWLSSANGPLEREDDYILLEGWSSGRWARGQAVKAPGREHERDDAPSQDAPPPAPSCLLCRVLCWAALSWRWWERGCPSPRPRNLVAPIRMAS